MIYFRFIATLSMMCFAILLMKSPVRAATCGNQFSDLATHRGIVQATVTISQSNGTVSYAHFLNLLFSPATARVGERPFPARLTGTSDAQLFNDRDSTQPFPVSKADKLAMEISSIGGATVTLRSLTWNSTSGFVASCDGGLMYGYSNGAAYAISFQLSPPIQ
jgi:hypothetical protein